MSNTKRPSLERKHTRKTIEKHDAELDQGIAVTDDDGTRLQVRVRDVRGSHDAKLYALIGHNFMGLLQEVGKRPHALALLAAVLWFCRLVNGRDPGDFEELLDEFGYEHVLSLDPGDPAEEDDAPKEPASSS